AGSSFGSRHIRRPIPGLNPACEPHGCGVVRPAPRLEVRHADWLPEQLRAGCARSSQRDLVHPGFPEGPLSIEPEIRPPQATRPLEMTRVPVLRGRNQSPPVVEVRGGPGGLSVDSLVELWQFREAWRASFVPRAKGRTSK